MTWCLLLCQNKTNRNNILSLLFFIRKERLYAKIINERIMTILSAFLFFYRTTVIKNHNYTRKLVY
jgi:hypothetical protein